ncbi:MAG: hypothetical protein JSU86_00280 [Phycisphaerales bacterium]|nr:MAG: hypothetical protein JSU86_00280 [Phycisphaerales bacterium]
MYIPRGFQRSGSLALIMGREARFIVLNGDETFRAELRSTLLKVDGVKLVAEVEEPALLLQAVQQFPVEVLLVNLDPNPEAVLPIVGDVAGANRELAIFATSESTDGQLILKAMRMGIKEFLPKPIDTRALEEAIGRIAVDRAGTATQGSLITVVGTSGGVGATMITTNLAVELAAIAEGHVTVVDLDYRYGQVATLLDVDPKYSLADLCSSPEALEPQVIGRALTKHNTGLDVLGRPNYLAEADTITAAACMGVFSSLTQFNDYVVADGPTRFDVGGQSVLALSDVTLLVVQQLVPCVRNARRILENMRDTGYNLERARLICNRVGRGSGHLSVNDVSETLGLELFASIPDDWETASGAINLGEPFLTYSPKSKLRVAIQEIAERLHSPESQADDKDTRRQSLIGRIFTVS